MHACALLRPVLVGGLAIVTAMSAQLTYAAPDDQVSPTSDQSVSIDSFAFAPPDGDRTRELPEKSSATAHRYPKPLSTTWLVDETYVKIQGRWHDLYRGIDHEGQVLDCWPSRTRERAAAEAFFRRTISSTGCTPEHVVTDKASFYPTAIRTCAPDAKHTATGFYKPGHLDEPL